MVNDLYDGPRHVDHPPKCHCNARSNVWCRVVYCSANVKPNPIEKFVVLKFPFFTENLFTL